MSSPEEAPAQHQHQRKRSRQRDDPVVYGGDGDIRGSFADPEIRLKTPCIRLFQSELLDGQNKNKCERCNKLVAASKQMYILQPLKFSKELKNPKLMPWIHVRNINLLVLLCILVSHLILVITMHILGMQWVVGIAAMIRLSHFQLCKMSCLKRFTSFSSLVPTKGIQWVG